MVVEFLKAVADQAFFFEPSGASKEGVEKSAINEYDKQKFSDTAVGIMVKSIAYGGTGIPWRGRFATISFPEPGKTMTLSSAGILPGISGSRYPRTCLPGENSEEDSMWGEYNRSESGKAGHALSPEDKGL